MCRVIVILLLGTLCRRAFAEKNFWGHDMCNSDSDCSGLTYSCDETFGCTTSFWKVFLVMFGVFIGILVLVIVPQCSKKLCSNTDQQNNNSTASNNQQRSCQETATTANSINITEPATDMYLYPHNPNPKQPYFNQSYANEVDPPPPYSPYDARVSIGAEMNVKYMPSAPYSQTDYDDGYVQESQTHHHSKY